MTDTSKCPACGRAELGLDKNGLWYCQGETCEAEMTQCVLNRIRELEEYKKLYDDVSAVYRHDKERLLRIIERQRAEIERLMPWDAGAR